MFSIFFYSSNFLEKNICKTVTNLVLTKDTNLYSMMWQKEELTDYIWIPFRFQNRNKKIIWPWIFCQSSYTLQFIWKQSDFEFSLLIETKKNKGTLAVLGKFISIMAALKYFITNEFRYRESTLSVSYKMKWFNCLWNSLSTNTSNAVKIITFCLCCFSFEIMLC